MLPCPSLTSILPITKKTKSNFKVASNNEDPWFKPSDCEQCDQNLCYFVAMLMQIFHFSWSRARTERAVCLVARCLVFWELGVCVWNILSVFEGRLFQIVSGPQRALSMCESHVESHSVCAVQRVTVYKGELFPLRSVASFRLRYHWSAELQLNLVGWQPFPASHPLPNC